VHVTTDMRVEGTLSAPIIEQLKAEIAGLTARLAVLEGTPGGTVVPARIEAESYDIGGPGAGYLDTTPGNMGGAYRTDDVDIKVSAEGGYAVGWIMAGEWLTYTVYVPTGGAHTLIARVGSALAGRSFRFTVDGADVTGQNAVPQTAEWDQYGNVSTRVSLAAGQHVIGFGAGQEDYLDFQWLEVTRP
jgi:hypothetical protein